MFESITQALGGESEGEEDEDEPPAGSAEAEAAPVGPPGGAAQAPEGPAPAELSSRIDELEDDIESTNTSLSEIQNTQRETMESVDEVNETVRRLAGIYDQVAASQNPFVDGDEGGSPAEDTPVVDDPPTGGRDDATDAHGDESGAAAADSVSFDDAGSTSDTTDTGPTAADSVSFDDLDSAPDGGQNGEPDGGGDTGASASADEYVLEAVPEGYAAELLVMEWLSRLIQRSGPAGAFRAVEQYHDVGMISTATRDHAIEVIAGPSLDVFVDPTESDEPSVEEHRVSSAYLRALERLAE